MQRGFFPLGPSEKDRQTDECTQLERMNEENAEPPLLLGVRTSTYIKIVQSEIVLTKAAT